MPSAHRTRRRGWRSATLALTLGLVTPTAVHADTMPEPLPVPTATFDFEDGLQGWTVEELPLTLESGSPSQGRGLHDTMWERVPSGHLSDHGVAITALGGSQEVYGDSAHVAFVSPVLEAATGPLVIEAQIAHHLEANTYDHVHAEWAPVGGTWSLLETFGRGEAGAAFDRAILAGEDFTPASPFQVRFRLVSDVLGSGVTPNPETYGGFWLDDVRVLPEAELPELTDGLKRWVVKALPGRPGKAEQTAVLAFASAAPINPYHEEFRDRSPLARRHPSTWIDGYPADAVALELSLDAPSLEEALAADEGEWANVREGQLYWIPGTKIVAIHGAALMEGGAVQVCDGEGSCDLRPGALRATTWAASRAAGNTAGACPDCRVAVFGGKGANSVDAVVGESGWLDAAAVMIPTTHQAFVYDDFSGAAERAAEHLFVTVPARYMDSDLGLDQAPLPSALSNPGYAPGVVVVGGHDSGHVYGGNEFPTHLVEDVCGAVVAEHGAMTGTAPIGLSPLTAQGEVLGHAGQLLVEARRLMGDSRQQRPQVGPLADGEFSGAELKRLVFSTATSRPDGVENDGPRCAIEENDPTSLTGRYASLPLRWSDVPAEAPGYVNLGYGATDGVARALALAVLRGEADLPERVQEDAWFALDDEARAASAEARAWVDLLAAATEAS